MVLAPPREMHYATFEDLYRSVQAHARTEGYCINPQSKKSLREAVKRYELRCDRSGKFKPNPKLPPDAQQHAENEDQPQGQQRKQRRRKTTTTKKTNCPFHASAIWDEVHNVWRLRVQHPSHNHPPSENPGAHPRHRAEEREMQRPLIADGVAKGLPANIIYANVLAAFPNTIVEFKDVDNLVHAIRRDLEKETPDDGGGDGGGSLPPLSASANRVLGGPRGVGCVPASEVPNPPAPPPVTPNTMLMMAAEIKKLKDEIRRLKQGLGVRDRKIEMLEWERVVFLQRFDKLEKAVFSQNPAAAAAAQQVPPPAPPRRQAPPAQAQSQQQNFAQQVFNLLQSDSEEEDEDMDDESEEDE